MYIYDSDDHEDYQDDEFEEGGDSATQTQDNAPFTAPALHPVTAAADLGDHASANHAALPSTASTAALQNDSGASHTPAASAETPNLLESTAQIQQSMADFEPAERTSTTGSLMTVLRGRMTKLSKHLTQKLQTSAPSLGKQQAQLFTQKSAALASSNREALPALAHILHEKLAQIQIELVEVKEYRAAAEHRQKLAAAAASMAAFTQDRLEVGSQEMACNYAYLVYICLHSHALRCNCRRSTVPVRPKS